MVERKLLPVGQAYLAHVRRAVHKLTFEEHDKHTEEEQKRLAALNGNGTAVEDDLGVGDEEETEDLLGPTLRKAAHWGGDFIMNWTSSGVALAANATKGVSWPGQRVRVAHACGSRNGRVCE